MPGRASSCAFEAELISTRSAVPADPLALCAGGTKAAIALAVTLGAHTTRASSTPTTALQTAIVHLCFVISGSSFYLVVIHFSQRGSPLLVRRLRTYICRSSSCRSTGCLLCGKRRSPDLPRPFRCRQEA